MRKSLWLSFGILCVALLAFAAVAFTQASVVAQAPAQSTAAPTDSSGASGAGNTTASACPTGLAAKVLPGLVQNMAQGAGAANAPTAQSAAPSGAATQAAGAPAAMTSPVCLVAELKGSNEVPTGDPKGIGFAAIGVDPTNNSIMFDVAVSGITLPATGMHIHVGADGVAGDIVVPADKFPDASGMATTTVMSIDPTLIQNILANPAGYYFNVHNQEFPGGALRGALKVYNPSDYPTAGASGSGSTTGGMDTPTASQ